MTARFRLTRAGVRVLRVLAQVDHANGFEIARTARSTIGRIYPQLLRMETAGWIESWWDPPERSDGKPRRRYYRITDVGRDQAQRHDTPEKA